MTVAVATIAFSLVTACTQSASGTFGPAGSLAEARFVHTGTLLEDGRVLIVGGWDQDRASADDTFASAEVWEPATASFSTAGFMAEARDGHTATPLPDGRVLVVGGEDRGASDSAEVWDPVTESFGPAGSLDEARVSHTAALLSDGRVLIVGGVGDEGDPSVASAEVWDPATEKFGPAGSLDEARVGHTATLLSDGRVLIVGGHDRISEQMPLASVEVWDPATETFGPAGSLAEARAGHTATLLPDGRVLVAGGGGDGGILASAEVWDPETEAFSQAGSLADKRFLHTATSLPDGRVLIVGGVRGIDGHLVSAEVWDPATESFGPAGSLDEARMNHTATLLRDGGVLVVGGGGGGDILASAEVWEPDGR